MLPKDSDQCNELSGLAKKQKKVCRRHVDVMNAVKDGAVRAIDECQWQFRTRRWNCSYVDSNTIFGNALSQGGSTTFVEFDGWLVSVWPDCWC